MTFTTQFCVRCNKMRRHMDNCCIVCLDLYADEERRHLLGGECEEEEEIPPQFKPETVLPVPPKEPRKPPQ